MYPFEIIIDRHVFACLNRIEFWYPRFHLVWLPKGTNFVTADPSYPDMTAPWHQKPESMEDWDLIPF